MRSNEKASATFLKLKQEDKLEGINLKQAMKTKELEAILQG